MSFKVSYWWMFLIQFVVICTFSSLFGCFSHFAFRFYLFLPPPAPTLGPSPSLSLSCYNLLLLLSAINRSYKLRWEGGLRCSSFVRKITCQSDCTPIRSHILLWQLTIKFQYVKHLKNLITAWWFIHMCMFSLKHILDAEVCCWIYNYFITR